MRRFFLGRVDGEGASPGSSQQKRAVKTALNDLRVQFFKVCPRQWFYISIDDGRTGTLILAIFTSQPVRQRDGELRVYSRKHIRQRQLMGRVDIRMQQAHGHGANALLLQLLTQGNHLLPVQFFQRFSLVIHPFRHFENSMAWHQGIGFSIFQVIERVPVGTSQQVNIAKSLCRDNGKLSAGTGE